MVVRTSCKVIQKETEFCKLLTKIRVYSVIRKIVKFISPDVDENTQPLDH